MVRQFFSAVLLLILLVGLSSCADTVKRGEVIKPFQLEQLVIGKSNYNDILNILGTPTSVSTYDPRFWYYFSQTKSQWGFLEPTFQDQEVYQVKLDDQGNYLGYKKFTGNDAVKLSVSKNTTPTVARDKSFLQELVTNFGRYSKPKADPNAPTNPAQRTQ
ncbi:MAG: outer membrane protein assembly factor BamE [Hydrotalea sp.]|nr:outer membrane protein assembly factor BamE [Hydrotalea sp.]